VNVSAVLRNAGIALFASSGCSAQCFTRDSIAYFKTAWWNSYQSSKIVIRKNKLDLSGIRSLGKEKMPNPLTPAGHREATNVAVRGYNTMTHAPRCLRACGLPDDASTPRMRELNNLETV